MSLYRITAVSQTLDSINDSLVPMGRLLSQLQSDAQIFKREMDQNLGYSNWNKTLWRPGRIPRWIGEILESELARAKEYVSAPDKWDSEEARARWKEWLDDMSVQYGTIQEGAEEIYLALVAERGADAARVYPAWEARLNAWVRGLEAGALRFDSDVRKAFGRAESQVNQSRVGLEVILVVVVVLSFLLFWLGERTLRPLGELTRLAREISERGLRREDQRRFPVESFFRSDELSQLSREFKRMATQLLEREKTVESQNVRLQEQNRQLKELTELQERLKHAEHFAAIGRMSAQVAHEIRNPLHSIGLEAEVALEIGADRGMLHPDVKQSLVSILASVERLEKITENYLKLSRLSAGERGDVDLSEVLERVLATYTPQCEKAGIRVDWRIERHASFVVRGDVELLEQALGNLFRNSIQAIEASGGEGRGGIRWSLGNTESGKVWIRIEDDGPGFDPEVRRKLFTPFVTTKAQGTGLGLSFVKKVLEEHGGDILLRDAASVRGACFEIFVPMASTVADAATATATAIASDDVGMGVSDGA